MNAKATIFGKPTKREVFLLLLVLILSVMLYMERNGGVGADNSSQFDETAAPGKKKPLFYRNPMNPAITSSVPAKDEMGMDYIPVYANGTEKPSKTPEQEAEDFFAEDTNAVPGFSEVTLTQNAINAAGIITTPALNESFQITIRTIGSVLVDETRLRHVQTKTEGWIEELRINFVGQLVKKGDPMLSIYSPELIANQEEYIQALEAYERLKRSGDPMARKSGEAILNAARRRLELYDIPKSEIEMLKKTRLPKKSLTLDAPMTGFVIAKDVVVGHKAETGAILFTIADLSVVWVEADFYEYEAGLLKLGQTAVLTSPFDPSINFEGKVTFIYPYLNIDSRTQKVRIEFLNETLILKPGMYVDVSLQVDIGETVIVPDSAIINTGVRKIVFLEKGNGIFEPREIKTGVRSRGKTEVKSGIQAGDKVVIKANFLLDSESSLQAIIQQQTAAQANSVKGDIQ
ncbi:efflux RND transporter periplasmic adaptor subunit [bacterium]|nr:efflux RND transporter periplasmic adaptor subunit [bacterium]